MSGSTSPLLLQALAGANQQIDPAIGAQLPKIQLAQALMQQGSDASPTSKWGGISRLAAALTGGFMFNQGNQGVQDVLAQRAKDAQSFAGSLSDSLTPPGAPAGAGQPKPTPLPQPPPAAGAPPLAGAVHQLESSGSMRPGVVGDGGAAAGVMQVHQDALTDVNKANGTNYTMADLVAHPDVGKWAGDRYLELQQQRFPGRPDLALAAYNAGPGATQHAVDSGAGVAGLPGSTQSYVNRGMALAGTQVAGPGAPQDAAPQSPGQAPQTGAQNPGLAKGMQTILHAQQYMLSHPYDAQAQKMGQMAIDNAHLMMGLDTFHTLADGTQINDRTGQVANAATPRMDYKPDPNNPGILVSPGAKPVVLPPPRTTTTPAGATVAVGPGGTVTTVAPVDNPGVQARHAAEAGGTAAGAGQWAPAAQNGVPGQQNAVTGEFKPTVTGTPRLIQTSGGAILSAAPGSGAITTAAPADNPATAAKAAATAQGTETGKQAVTTAGKMVQLGHDSDSAIGNIDYGMNQLHQAAAGGINSGYFAPILATAAAAGKSLDLNLPSFGINQEAVGNIQSAQKTLGVVSGAILQQAIGKDSQITDAKIDHFIHTQPDIATDPHAIERVLNWARSQFVFNREMAMDAMHHTNPDSGMLPPGWQASFIAKKGAFAPIYDPLSQEMAQPTGQGPSATPPPAAASSAAPPATSKPAPMDVHAEMVRRGLIK